MGAKPRVFTDRESRALAPPERLKPSEWADRHRFLPPTIAAEPGRYRIARTPYIVGIIDAITEPYVEELVFLKAAQVGFTTAIQNLLGWVIDQESAPALLVMPSQDEARKLVEENLKPLVEHTPQLKTHLTGDAWDITKESLRFDSMTLHLGWAGSPATLARRAVRFVFFDEVDKYPQFSGKDANPLDLGRARKATYLHRGRSIVGSTPTTRDGHVWKAYENCGDKRHYAVPCPHCGEYQQLTFPQVKIPGLKHVADKAKRAEAIEGGNLAHYECCHCGGKITDQHKPKMLGAGVWLSQTQTIDRYGVVSGERPRAKRVGFHISALYSPWVSFSRLAAQFVRSTGDTGAMMEFKNQWLGEVFEEVVTSFKTDDLRKQLATAPEAGKVPKWAGAVIVSADTQKDRFYYVARAWGGGYRSQLVAHGEAGTLQELRRVLDNAYAVEGTDDYMVPCLLLIDSGGHRADEVYAFTREDPRIIAVKGAPGQPRKLIEITTPAKDIGVQLRLLDTQTYKDRLAGLREDGKWFINNAVDDDYLRQIASEVKVLDRKSGRMMWQPSSAGAANHYFDCEVYNRAGADIAQVMYIPDEATLEAQRQAEHEQRERVKQQQQAAPRYRPQPQTSSWLKPSGKGGWL